MKHIIDISDFIFMEDAPQSADIIFIPGGGYPQPSEYAADLYNKGMAKLILPSGRHSVLKGKFTGVMEKQEKYNKAYKDEWEFMSDVLIQNGVSQSAILKENRAENTYQNAMYSKQVIDEQGIEIKKAIICCKAQHSRRSYMYYQVYFPDVEFIICPIVVNNISRTEWYKTDKGKKSVMGEILRIGQQFEDLI